MQGALAAASKESDRKRFEEWMKKYKKEYSSLEEKETRFSAYKENLRDVEANIAEYPNGNHWKGLTCFSDMTFAQFLTDHLGIDFGPRHYHDSEEDDDEDEALIKATFDSEDEGEDEVPIKRQRICCKNEKDVDQPQASVSKV